MKKLDYYLQNVRFAKAKKYIRKNDKVLDIGSYNDSMFEQLGAYISEGVGIDPSLKQSVQKQNYRMIRGHFPQDCPDTCFDVVTMLAVLEHIKPSDQQKIVKGCLQFLKPGGLVVITVPSVAVDTIIKLLQAAGVLDGIATEEHYGFRPKDLLQLFQSPHYTLYHHSVFQFGLNNLFVFKKF